MQETYANKIYGQRRRDAAHSAIQITTAAGICAMLDLLVEGKLPRAGLHPAGGRAASPTFLANRFGRVYARRRRSGAHARR